MQYRYNLSITFITGFVSITASTKAKIAPTSPPIPKYANSTIDKNKLTVNPTTKAIHDPFPLLPPQRRIWTGIWLAVPEVRPPVCHAGPCRLPCDIKTDLDPVYLRKCSAKAEHFYDYFTFLCLAVLQSYGKL